MPRRNRAKLVTVRQGLPEQITEICHAINKGLVLGNDRFRAEAEQLTGQRQHHLKRGPKPKPTPSPEFLL